MLRTRADRDRDRPTSGTGAPLPAAWTNTLRYGSVDLSLLFQGVLTTNVLNLYQMYYGLQAEPRSTCAGCLRRNAHIRSGKVITDYSSKKAITCGSKTSRWAGIPKSIHQGTGGLRLYGTVRNVFTLTKYTGLDRPPWT
jgi:hypothetical protein